MDYDVHASMPSLEEEILTHLSTNGPSTRTDLCEALSVSRTTLGRAVNQLIREHAVMAIDDGASKTRGAGRPSQALMLAHSCAYAVGIIVARSTCSAVLVNRGGEVLSSILESVSDPNDLLSTLKTVSASLASHAHERGIITRHIRSIGVGVPIPMGSNLSHTPDSSFPSHEEITATIAQTWQGQVVVDTTARLSALSESLWGAAQGVSSVLYVRLSHGIGASLIFSYRLSGGNVGFAAEFGHIRVPNATAPCTCGKTGCLETIASVPALCEQAGVEDLTKLSHAVARSHSPARTILTQAMEAVGACCANAALLVNPSSVVIAGELPEAIPEVTQMIARGLNAELIPALNWHIDVVGAKLGPLHAAQAAAYAATTASAVGRNTNRSSR